jgi:hypothetical protein
MDDLNKLLEGSTDDVKAGIAGKSHDDLQKLKTAEQAGQARKGVLSALDTALTAADEKRTGGRVQDTASIGTIAIAAALDTSGPAGIEPASAFSTSGAPVQVVPDVDPSHPAIDNDPRAGTTVNMNRIDMNDPYAKGSDVVEQQLAAQSED